MGKRIQLDSSRMYAYELISSVSLLLFLFTLLNVVIHRLWLSILQTNSNLFVSFLMTYKCNLYLYSSSFFRTAVTAIILFLLLFSQLCSCFCSLFDYSEVYLYLFSFFLSRSLSLLWMLFKCVKQVKENERRKIQWYW